MFHRKIKNLILFQRKESLSNLPALHCKKGDFGDDRSFFVENLLFSDRTGLYSKDPYKSSYLGGVERRIFYT